MYFKAQICVEQNKKNLRACALIEVPAMEQSPGHPCRLKGFTSDLEVYYLVTLQTLIRDYLDALGHR